MKEKNFSIIAFTFVVCGVITQGWHFYSIADMLAWGYDGSWQKTFRVAYSIFSAVFLSGGIMFFTIRYGALKNSNYNNEMLEIKKRKYARILNMCTIFEIFSNLYYWMYSLVFFKAVQFTDTELLFRWHKIDYFSLPPALLFAVAIPLLIRSYAGEITVKLKHEGAQYKQDTLKFK